MPPAPTVIRPCRPGLRIVCTSSRPGVAPTDVTFCPFSDPGFPGADCRLASLLIGRLAASRSDAIPRDAGKRGGHRPDFAIKYASPRPAQIAPHRPGCRRQPRSCYLVDILSRFSPRSARLPHDMNSRERSCRVGLPGGLETRSRLNFTPSDQGLGLIVAVSFRPSMVKSCASAPSLSRVFLQSYPQAAILPVDNFASV